MTTVTRYVPTYVGKDGMRTLMTAAQGRNTYATHQEAQDWLVAVLLNNSGDTLASVYGPNPQFAVCACPCYPGHFDPQRIYFDESDVVRESDE